MVEAEHLAFGWFTVFVILVTGYAVLDGFDLGVGILHLFSKKDVERRLMLNSIGPVWDGNEVWLVTAGGALFAGFPVAYATICSGFYPLIMAFLGGIIFRAVAIEFRSKRPMAWWRWMWDILFALASFVIAFGLGVVLGNLIRGIPLDEHLEFSGDFFDLIHPYSILVGVFAVALFLMHGSIYLVLKTEGEFHDQIRSWVNRCIIFFIIMYGIVTAMTLIYHEHMAEAIRNRPYFFLVALLNMLAIANVPREIHHGRDGRAFLSSCASIVFLMALFGVGTYPNIVRNSAAPDVSVTLYNAGSSVATFKILFLIAAIGVPLVIAYTIGVYWIFRGKVKLESTSY